MKRILNATFLALAILFIPACGGGGGSSSAAANQTQKGGLAPESLTTDMYLTPAEADVGGRIKLVSNSVRTAYFSSERNTQGDYVDGDFAPGRNTYRGNYIYTKCGPDMAELRVENLRAETGDSAHDCIWNVIGYLHFLGKDKVSFTGTETLIDSHNGNEEAAEDAGDHNDPLGFSGVGSNHFPGVQHTAGGSRNFNCEYTYTMGN